MKSIFESFKPAIYFIGLFLGLYFLLNTLYGMYVDRSLPQADDITVFVAHNCAWILSISDEQVTARLADHSPYVSLLNKNSKGVSVFEGCNGINVAIVYLCFLVAFRGGMKSFIKFLLLGLLVIYAANLARVCLLYEMAIFYPKYLYFFHKYLFTAILYGVVFVLWYYWVNHVRKNQPGTSGTDS